MRIRNVAFEAIMLWGLWGLVAVVLFGLVVLGFTALAVIYVYEQNMMFSCIENGGIWLKSYQVGCTYPHG